MAASLCVFILGLQLCVGQAIECPNNYQAFSGVCLNYSSTKVPWCKAQEYCASVNGELVRGTSFLPLDNKSVPGVSYFAWIGMTDFLIERGTNRSGWMWCEDGRDPQTNQLTWKTGEPNNPLEDCLLTFLGSLYDYPCGMLALPLCQTRIMTRSWGRSTHFSFVPISVEPKVEYFAQNDGCSKILADAASETECAILCSAEPSDWCVSFYYHQGKKECRILLYADATVDLVNADGWLKFVVKK